MNSTENKINLIGQDKTKRNKINIIRLNKTNDIQWNQKEYKTYQ